MVGLGQGCQPGGKLPGPATQCLHGAWAAYTIVITSIGIKNIIISFLIIIFLV
jgi:hypothetical protein